MEGIKRDKIIALRVGRGQFGTSRGIRGGIRVSKTNPMNSRNSRNGRISNVVIDNTEILKRVPGFF